VSTIKVAVVVAAYLAGAAYALPGDVVVISDKEVRPDEDAGLYYLGQAAGGCLYNGSSAAVGRVAPYRLLDRDARAKDYYIVWAPDWVGATPAAFEHLGAAVQLSENEILVGLEPGLGPGALRAVDHRIELIKLEPVTPVEWRYDGEEPPTKKDPWIQGAINTITEEEYAGYIKQLQDFKTRYTDLKGFEYARDYLSAFFAAQNVSTYEFPFKYNEFRDISYADPSGKIYLLTLAVTVHRTADGGESWDVVVPVGIYNAQTFFWADGETGFVAGLYNNKLAKTYDGGRSWETVDIYAGIPRAVYYVYAMHFFGAQTGWLAGSVSIPNRGVRGFVMKTSDGGLSWVEQQIPSEFEPRALAFYDEGHGWAAGGTTIFYTDDGGETWRKTSSPPIGVVEDIAAVSPREAWATAGTRLLLRTVDGVSWNTVDPGTEGVYSQIEFPDPEYGYAAGSAFIATQDGGASWREVANAPVMTYDLVSFADRYHGIFADNEAENAFRTDDGGESFVNVLEKMRVHAENVIGEREGETAPEEIVIICGHFDSVAHSDLTLAPGAEDNASGTACAMAAARAFKDLRFKRTVRYIAFGAEEMGVIGSREYAKHCAAVGEKIVAVLNADMVAYDEDGGARDDYSLACSDYTWLFDYLVSIGGLYDNDLIYDRQGWYSDHASFWNVGYAAIGAIEGGVGVGKVMEYPYYHTTEDTLDKLHPELGVRLVRDYAAMFAHLAGISDVGVKDPRKRATAAVPFVRPFAVYPNPYCYATSAGGINFVGLKSPATVEIYDLAGRRVAREQVAVGCDECVWRPAGAEGESLAPGVYVYSVEGQEQKKAGKIVIAR